MGQERIVIESGFYHTVAISFYLFVLILTTILSVIIFLTEGTTFLFILLVTFSVLSAIGTVRNFRERDKRVELFPNSIEISIGSNLEIIPFADIINIKIQFEELRVGYYFLSLVDVAYIMMTRIQNKPYFPRNKLSIEIESETSIFKETMTRISPKQLSEVIRELYYTTGVNPRAKEFQRAESYGTFFYFAFTEVHPDLDPDVTKELI